MPRTQKFYYSFKKNYIWLIANITMLVLLISCTIRHPACWFWWQMQVLLSLFTLTLLMWGYKYLLKHQVAEISERGIKIDHNHLLKWNDIIAAEYRVVDCCFRKLPVISLRTPRHLRYKYNYLQRHCEKIGFGAFSIPLYDMKKEDIHKLSHIIVDQVGDIYHT